MWIDMICYMHEGTPYGHLKVGSKVILPSNLAAMVGATLEQVEGWLEELREAEVFDVTEDGVMCSRRMIRDESIRNARAEGGKLGGNPSLVGKKVNLKDNQKTTPSSSSSFSSSSSSSSSIVGAVAPAKKASRMTEEWQLPKAWGEWAVAEHNLSVETVRLEANKFRDYWLAKAGKDGAKLDWSATWRNWVRNSLEFSPAAKPGFQTQGERNQDVLQGLTRGAVGGGNVKLLGS